MQATITDWPNGSRRVEARFWIEIDAKRGERAVRETTGAAKKLTFARKMRIVDGDDGRTYIVAFSGYGHVTVWRGDMKFNEEVVHERDSGHAELLALFS
jgi:hypothetical protein